MADYGDFTDKWPDERWENGEWWCSSGPTRVTAPLEILQQRFAFTGYPPTFTRDNGRLWRWSLEELPDGQWRATPLGLEEDCARRDRLTDLGWLVSQVDPLEYFA